MSSNLYSTPKGASAGYNYCVGHIDSSGNVYNTPSGTSAGRNHCVGHIESDGNVYNVPWGVNVGRSHCVGHFGDDGNIYNVPKGVSAGLGSCVGHVDSNGNVYNTPAGASAGLSSCVGHVEGGNYRQGGAALLLLLKGRPTAARKSSFLNDFPGLTLVGIFVLVFLIYALFSGQLNAELFGIGLVALAIAAGLFAGRKIRERGSSRSSSYGSAQKAAYQKKPPKQTPHKQTSPKQTPPKQTPPKQTPPKQVYAFFKCPSCGQTVRVPAGKGHIQITCPKCKSKFKVKS